VPPARRSRLTVALAAVALASAVPASAAAALPPGRSGFYGGGAVGAYLQFVSLRVQPGGALAAHATLVTSCAPRFGDELTENVSLASARLDGAGRYSATTPFSHDVAPGVPGIGGLRAEGTTAFSARVLAGGRARGVVRVRTTYLDPATGAEVSRCDTGRIAWLARRPPGAAGAGTPALQPGTHRGTTDRDEPFLMRVTRRGRRVRRAGLTVRVGCPSAVGLPLDVVAHRLRVRRGRFHGAGDFRRPFTLPDGTEVVESYSWELRGRFGLVGARGTFELHGVVRRRSDGLRMGSCDSGATAWRAASYS
jgi:hypothetical protein